MEVVGSRTSGEWLPEDDAGSSSLGREPQARLCGSPPSSLRCIEPLPPSAVILRHRPEDSVEDSWPEMGNEEERLELEWRIIQIRQ